MDSNFQQRLIYLILALPAYVLAFTIHEFAHAIVADKLGDPTPRRAGKLSLDPFKMLDPIGSLLLVATLLMGLPLLGFAWVPVNKQNFKDPYLDDAKVAVAGPLSNFAQAVVWLILLVAFIAIARATGHAFSVETILGILNRRPDMSSMWSAFAAMMAIGVILNISLGVFNLLPLPPFDGGFIIEAFVPPLRPVFDSIRPMGFMIIFLLINAGPSFRAFFEPVQDFADGVVLRAFGENPKDYSRSPE